METKKMSKEELIKKVAEEQKKATLSAAKAASKPAKKTSPTSPKSEKKPLFPETLEVEDLGILKKASFNSYKELKERENLVFVFYWDAKHIKKWGYNDLDSPEVKSSDLFKGAYDLCVPVYYKETKEHVVVVSQITESIFELCVPEWYADITDKEFGDEKIKICNDLVFQVYEIQGTTEKEEIPSEDAEEE